MAKDWLKKHLNLPIPDIFHYAKDISRRRTYWERVEDALEEPPAVGPMLPSHQRWYNMDIAEETDSRPEHWTKQWIEDRLCEIRIRFNISPDVPLNERDILRCENHGIKGIRPEWKPLPCTCYLKKG